MFDLRQLNRAHSAQNMVKRRSGVKGSRDAGPTIRLVTMTIDTDVTLDEAILKDGECIGYVTSGGYEHHVQQSMALGYVAGGAGCRRHRGRGRDQRGDVFGKGCRLPTL